MLRIENAHSRAFSFLRHGRLFRRISSLRRLAIEIRTNKIQQQQQVLSLLFFAID
jgi:hypothetical protein